MKKKNKLKSRKQKYQPKTNPFAFIPQAELDFHNFGELTVYDIEKYLSEFIEDCYVAKLKNVLVITGKGLVVRPLVLKLLKQNKYVESFKSAGYFNGQHGAVEVVLF
jgi:DNA-nicking Smr family endonuclease